MIDGVWLPIVAELGGQDFPASVDLSGTDGPNRGKRFLAISSTAAIA